MTVRELSLALESFRTKGYSDNHEVMVVTPDSKYHAIVHVEADWHVPPGSDQSHRTVNIYTDE